MNLNSNKSRYILFIVFLMITPLMLAPTLQAEKASAGGLPLETFLTADGYLNLPVEGIPGSIDPTGYTLANEPGKVPRFVPTDTAESIPATCEDLAWDSHFYSDGVDGDVRAMAWDGSNLYVGGWFATAGGVVVNNIAKWDGNNWIALGSGMNAQVSSLAWDGNNLYAGGFFTAADGNPANRVAKWDGNNWSSLGSGMENVVRAMAWDGSNLYAGGAFSLADGNPVNRIA